MISLTYFETVVFVSSRKMIP